MGKSKVKVVGKVANNPVLSTTKKNTYCCAFQIVTNEFTILQDSSISVEEVTYDVYEFGEHAKCTAKYLEQGLSCEVSGILEQKLIVDQSTGMSYLSDTITAKNVHFLEYPIEMQKAYEKRYSRKRKHRGI
jgi:single-stranded DNA-binding protein